MASPTDLLPAWWAHRMQGDHWHFGLLLDTGHVVLLSEVINLVQDANGELWVDVDAENPMELAPQWAEPDKIITAPTSRTTMSIAVKHIVAAFETADT